MAEKTETGGTATITPPAGPIEAGPFDNLAVGSNDDPLGSMQLKDPGQEPAPPEETGSEVKDEGKEPETPEVKEPLPEDKKPEVEPKPEEGKGTPLIFGRFKTLEAAEKAYSDSGREARRLKAESVSLAKNVSELNEKIAQYESERELGQFQEMSEDQLLALMASDDPKDRLQAQKYIVAQQSFKDKKARLESERNRAKQDADFKERQVQAYLEKELEHMASDSKNYPQFKELVPLMDQVLDWLDGTIAGHPRAPELVYFAARGMATVQAEVEGAKASQADAEKAKNQALAKAKAAGSSGAVQTGKTPGSASEDDFVDRLVRARPKTLIEF